MNYAWEAVLMEEKNGGNRSKLRFTKASVASPYMEVSSMDLNIESPEGSEVEINPFYRLGDVFGKLFDQNTKEWKQTREIFFDVCMHYIVQLDMREGLAREDYYCGLIVEDIENGRYGTAFGELFGLFDRKERKKIVRAYRRLLKTGNYLGEFRRIMTKLYPRVFIYENSETAFELLVYLGRTKTEKEMERAAFLRETFLPMQEAVHFFYENHFGIIGLDETMVVGEMVLF